MTCGDRQVCVGGACTCVPGYTGTDCTTPLCVQDCHHGGYCSAPDTCACPPGWFDANCTTPVCTQTCGNGGNCTGPNICTCPDDWTGVDCRVPVCEQAEWNGHDGKLLLQDPGVNTPQNTSRLGVRGIPLSQRQLLLARTCVCPPQWSGHDCSSPVCTQGVFKPDPDKRIQRQRNLVLHGLHILVTWLAAFPPRSQKEQRNVLGRTDTAAKMANVCAV